MKFKSFSHKSLFVINQKFLSDIFRNNNRKYLTPQNCYLNTVLHFEAKLPLIIMHLIAAALANHIRATLAMANHEYAHTF